MNTSIDFDRYTRAYEDTSPGVSSNTDNCLRFSGRAQ